MIGRSQLLNKVLVLLVIAAVAGVTLGGLRLAAPEGVRASEHSATRSFSATSVDPGDTVTVTIVAENYGDLGRIVETVPEGFTTDNGSQTVSIILLSPGPQTRTYTVTATDSPGDHIFEGTIADQNRDSMAIGGEDTVTITGTAPPPEPTPSATRSISPGSVRPGGEFTVTIVAENFGSVGRIKDTVPEGFDITSPETEGQTVTLRLLQAEPQTVSYTVTAPETTGDYMITGTLEDSERNTHTVTGASRIRVSVPAPPPPPPAPTDPTEPCLVSLSGDGSVSGTWGSGCTSTDREGRYARYYSFTLNESSDVTINLESSTDTYLYLRAGEAESGDFLHENDDVESGNYNSRIEATLSAGTYTIEATTFGAGETGSFTLTVSGLGGGTTPGPTDDPCLDSLSGDGSVNGTWGSGCTSTDREGRYARYYSFTLSEGSDVTIDLESSTDTYLYLRAGSAKSGDFLHENDDVEAGDYNSRIAATLGAGTYTIEATTYDSGEMGSFTLTVNGLGDGTTPEPTDPCLDSLSGNGSVDGTWSSACESTAREGSYARYYSFTLSESSDVTINLESSTDTYLYLRAGEAKSGDFLHENDDVESGVVLNSRIEATLDAGTYTIEATTYYAGETDSFTLTIGGL